MSIPIQTYIVKTTAFCNLNCSYCYMFNLGDKSYMGRPKVMSLEVVEASAQRMLDQALEQQICEVTVVMHGGEPLLTGKQWLRDAVEIFRRVGGDQVDFKFGTQTNGVLVDREWIALWDELGMSVSLSMDGPRHVQDKVRVNHAGRGSYDDVIRGLRLLLDTSAGQRCFGAVLSVIDPEAEGLEIYQHFRELGVTSMDFLLPLEHNWENPPPGHESPTATPYADYLIPIFDSWWEEDNAEIHIRNFETMLGHCFGSNHGLDSLGGNPISFGIIETDGSLEPLDVLRVCGDGFTNLGLNVQTDPISALYQQNLFQIGLQGQDGLCDTCTACPLHDVCGAGYLPHRYRKDTGFRNQSVYCRDLWKLIGHILSCTVERVRRPADSDSLATGTPAAEAVAGDLDASKSLHEAV